MHSLIIYFGENIFEIFKALAMIEIFCRLFKYKDMPKVVSLFTHF